MSTDIYNACSNNNILYMQEYIKNGGNLDIPDNEYGSTCIMFAAENNHEELCQLLIDNNANLHISNKAKNTLFYYVVLGNCINIIKYITNINDRHEHEETTLTVACFNNKLDIVVKLIEMKADLNVQNINKNTALMIACNKNYTEIASKLIKAGADLNIRNNKGSTALILTCIKNYIDIALMLIKSGADLNIQNNNNDTALIMSCDRTNKKITSYLIDAKADLNLQNSDGNNALMLTCINNNSVDNVENAIRLIDAKADLNLQNNRGSSALMIACKGDHPEIASYLMDHNAKIDLQSMSGNTALMFACKINYNKKLILKMVGRCPDLSIHNNANENVLTFACKINDNDIISILLSHIKITEREIIILCEQKNVEMIRMNMKKVPISIKIKQMIVNILIELDPNLQITGDNYGIGLYLNQQKY